MGLYSFLKKFLVVSIQHNPKNDPPDKQLVADVALNKIRNHALPCE